MTFDIKDNTIKAVSITMCTPAEPHQRCGGFPLSNVNTKYLKRTHNKPSCIIGDTSRKKTDKISYKKDCIIDKSQSSRSDKSGHSPTVYAGRTSSTSRIFFEHKTRKKKKNVDAAAPGGGGPPQGAPAADPAVHARAVRRGVPRARRGRARAVPQLARRGQRVDHGQEGRRLLRHLMKKGLRNPRKKYVLVTLFYTELLSSFSTSSLFFSVSFCPRARSFRSLLCFRLSPLPFSRRARRQPGQWRGRGRERERADG